ncbi:MAG: fructose-bisphosphatase class II, partial [Anaerolineales bacterium]
MNTQKPTRNLAMELVRVTESAALAAGRFMGRGQKEVADKAAVDAMRLVLNSIDMDAIVVIGEGEKDEAPMLFNGEFVGTGKEPLVDLAVDPIDGTRPLADGFLNSIATVSIAPRGTMFNPGPFVYMNKIAVGPAAKGLIDIEA